MYQNRWNNNQNLHQPPSQGYVHGAPHTSVGVADVDVAYYPNVNAPPAPSRPTPAGGGAGPHYYHGGTNAMRPEYDSQYRQPAYYQPEYHPQHLHPQHPQPQHPQPVAGYGTAINQASRYVQPTHYSGGYSGAVSQEEPPVQRVQYGAPPGVPSGVPQGSFSPQVSYPAPNSPYAVSYQPSEPVQYPRTMTKAVHYGSGRGGEVRARGGRGRVRSGGARVAGYSQGSTWHSQRYEQPYPNSRSHSRPPHNNKRGGRAGYAVQVVVDPRRPKPIHRDVDKINSQIVHSMKAQPPINQITNPEHVEAQVHDVVNEVEIENENEVEEEEKEEEEEEEINVYIPAYQMAASSSLDYLEVSRRHDRLVMPNDFVRVVHRWISNGEGPEDNSSWCSSLSLSTPLAIHHEVCCVASQLEAADLRVPVPQDVVLQQKNFSKRTSDPKTVGNNVLYNAKVLLLSGLSAKENETLAACGSLTNDMEGGDEPRNHITRLIKFVVARSERTVQGGVVQKSGLFLVGGRYNEALDGPLTENGIDVGLKRAAVRHVEALTGIDLSKSQRWLRCLDIQYVRPSPDSDPASVVNRQPGCHQDEITAVFVVDDAQACAPKPGDWPAAWQHRHMQRLESLPGGVEEGEVCEPASGKGDDTLPANGPCLMSIGLLTADHVKVKTMTLSLDGLLDYNETDVEEGTFEVSLVAEALHEMFMRDAGLRMLKALVERPWESMIEAGGEADQQETKRQRKDDGWRKDSQLHNMVAAFSYFDLGGLGYLLVDDVVAIIESLGKGFHHGALHQLCSQVAEESVKRVPNSHQEELPPRIHYRELLCIRNI